MSYRYRDDLIRLRVRDIARIGAAVVFLALLAGVYLSAWSSLPLGITFAGSSVLLGGWAVRHHQRSLRWMRSLRLHIDAGELLVERAGQAAHTVVTRDQVRAITYDGDGVVAIYDQGPKPVFRLGLRVLENGDAFWAELRQWGIPTEVPRGQFSVPESSGALTAITVFFGLMLYAHHPVSVMGVGLLGLAFLVWYMRVPWRHRQVSRPARLVVWIPPVSGC